MDWDTMIWTHSSRGDSLTRCLITGTAPAIGLDWRKAVTTMTVTRLIKCPTCIGIGYCGEGDKCVTCEGTGEVPFNEVIVDDPCQPAAIIEKARS